MSRLKVGDLCQTDGAVVAVSWPKYTRVETDTVCLVVETLTHGDVKVLTATGQIGILFCDEVVTYDPTGSGRHNGI